jgi:hypothetical protein
MLTGSIGFGLFRGIVAHLGARGTYPVDVVSNAGMAFASALWGITVGGLSTFLADEDLFRARRRANLTVKPVSSKVPPKKATVRS